MSPINPNRIKVRDPLMLAVIRGATKAGVQKDKKKEQSKRSCRRKKVPIKGIVEES